MEETSIKRWMVLGIYMLMICFVMSGCGSVKSQLNDPGFQAENQPIRTVKVIILRHESTPDNFIEKLMDGANQRFLEQAGIRFEIVSQIVYQTAQFNMAKQLQPDKSWEIAIRFPGKAEKIMSAVENLTVGFSMSQLLSGRYRQYVTVSSPSPDQFETSLWRCFCNPHQNFIIFCGSPLYLCQQTRQEVLKNKWRSFYEPLAENRQTAPVAVAPPQKVDTPSKLQPTPTEKHLMPEQVTTESANIRSGAGNEFPVVTTVNQGDKLMLLGERGEWFNVRLDNGQEGWINSRFVKE